MRPKPSAARTAVRLALISLPALAATAARAAVVDEFECTLRFHDSATVPAFETKARLAAVRVEDNEPQRRDVRLTRSRVGFETALPDQRTRANFELSFQHAVELGADGRPVRAAQAIGFMGLVQYPRTGIGYAYAVGGDPFDGADARWRPVALKGEVPTLDATAFETQSYGSTPDGIVDVNCRYLGTTE